MKAHDEHTDAQLGDNSVGLKAVNKIFQFRARVHVAYILASTINVTEAS